MSSAGSSPGVGENTILIILVILVFSVVRRVYRSYKGMRYSAGRTILFALFYVAFGSALSILSFFEGVPVLYAAPYVIIAAATAFWSYRYSDRRISFWRGGDGSIYFKGGVILYLIYVAGLIARLSISLIVIGPSAFDFASGVTLTSTGLEATIATDLLLMFGLGLLIGRNARVLKRGRAIEQGKEELPDSPPPLEGIFGSGKGQSPPSETT
jgi:hypothetical protein